MNQNENVLAGYFNEMKVWSDTDSKFVPFTTGVSGEFSFTLEELEDVKKFATHNAKTPRVYFELKMSRKTGRPYAIVKDPSTWVKKEDKPTAQAAAASDDLPF